MLYRILFRFQQSATVSRSFHVSYIMPKKQPKKEVTNKEENKLNPIGINKSGNITIKILAKPGAKLNSITDISEEGVGVQINAPPVDGEANTELIKYIATILNVKKSEIQLDRGSRSRQKTLLVTQNESLTVESVIHKLKSEIKA